MATILSRLLGAAPKRASHLVFTFYTRQGCGCCEKAMAVLCPRQEAHGFAINVVDIDGDPLLREKYGTTVPVLVVDGKERFRGKVDPALLDRFLAAEAGRSG
jgi:glutaredoxin